MRLKSEVPASDFFYIIFTGSKDDFMKILVIQQKMIGDVLTSTIICEALKKECPEATIHYLINTHTHPVVEGNPFIDEIIYFKDEYRKNKLRFFGFLKQIKAEEYDVVIDVYCKLESKLISLYSKAPKRISYEKSSSKYFYNILIPYLSEQQNEVGLAIQNRLELLTPILGKTPKYVRPKIYLTNEEIASAKAFLKQHAINPDQKIYMIGILGSDPSKTYPKAYMAQLLDDLVKNTDAVLLFNYIPSQKNEVMDIYNLCNTATKKQIRPEVYAPSLRSFLGILSLCDALIGNEGGAVNMAKALNIPTFAIFSPWITTEAWGLFENEDHVNVHLKDYKPELFESKNKKTIKSEIVSFYEVFEYNLIKEQLTTFINKH